MIDILAKSAEVLTQAGFTTGPLSLGERKALLFEDATVVGFLILYSNPAELIGAWDKDANRAISEHRFGLRRAGQKAWNVYVVLIAAAPAEHAHSAALAAVEEDLVGTRKIARAGVADIADLHAALLPLLPLQAAPKLEAVDIATEIRQRATELPPRAIDAFLSKVEEGVVMQVLEEGS